MKNRINYENWLKLMIWNLPLEKSKNCLIYWISLSPTPRRWQVCLLIASRTELWCWRRLWRTSRWVTFKFSHIPSTQSRILSIFYVQVELKKVSDDWDQSIKELKLKPEMAVLRDMWVDFLVKPKTLLANMKNLENKANRWLFPRKTYEQFFFYSIK